MIMEPDNLPRIQRLAIAVATANTAHADVSQPSISKLLFKAKKPVSMAKSATGLFTSVKVQAEWWFCKKGFLPTGNQAVAHLLIPVMLLSD